MPNVSRFGHAERCETGRVRCAACRRPVQSVERAAAMLRLLADENEPVGLAQIATALGLAKGTVHGLAPHAAGRRLHRADLPDRSLSGRAPEVFRLGWARLDPNELRSKALNWTDALAARTGESARVAAVHGWSGCGRPPCIPSRCVQSRSHRSGAADRERSVLVARQRIGKGAAGLRPRCCAQHHRQGTAELHVPDHHRSGGPAAGVGGSIRDQGWAASVEESDGGCVRRSPRRSATAGGSWWPPSVNRRVKQTGSATRGQDPEQVVVSQVVQGGTIDFP